MSYPRKGKERKNYKIMQMAQQILKVSFWITNVFKRLLLEFYETDEVHPNTL